MNLWIFFALPSLALAVETGTAPNAGASAPLFSREVRNCAQCHPAQARPHVSTAMAHAAETVAECRVLKAHVLLTKTLGPYTYRIERKGEESFYTVSAGAESFSVPIKYSLGQGFAGQTYVYEKNGSLYESMVSYYEAIDGLDLTMGDQPLHPHTLDEAEGRLMGEREGKTCMSCHNTNALKGDTLNLAAMIPGIQCERCHGDTAHHLDGIGKGDARAAAMKSLKGMSGQSAAEFCGQCHRTWENIATNGPHGITNVRFQPYRLTNSKCFDVDDARIACTACHDPHKILDKVAANYDAKCQACHAGGKPGALACKVGTKDCSTCHMPKLDLPGAHHQFTDHEIRIVRAGAPYPD